MGVHLDKKTGSWVARINYQGRDLRKFFKDKRTAEIAFAEVQNEIRIAKLARQDWDGFKKFQKATKQKTFGDAATEYMEERANFKSSSLVSYNYILKSNLLPEFGNRPLSDISETMIRKYMVSLSNTGISESRVNTIMQLFRSIMGQSYRKGEIPRDPTLSVKRLQEPKVDIDPLSSDDLAKALAHIDPAFYHFFVAQAYTGARPNELQALRWTDIDWKNEQISITKGMVRGKEGRPKTRSGERTIPMLEPVKKALIDLKRIRESSNIVPFNDFVFVDRKGNPIVKHMDRVWKTALKNAGVRHRPSYQLRHTFVTHCIIKNFPLPYIAKIIGHSTIDTLIRHYAGWIDSATKQHEAALRAAFSNESSPLAISNG